MIKNVALLGADGKLGIVVLQKLLDEGFNVTVLKRQSSTSSDNYPVSKSVPVSRIPDDLALEALTKVLHGKDALVVTIKGSQTDVQKKLADACVAANVKRFIPADFGSCDSSSPLTQELVPLYKQKTELREYLMQLARANASFSWTSIVCGHFFDYSLDFLHIFLQDRRADIIDDGEKKRASISTLARVGEATARILQHTEQTANQMLYVQSFCVSQTEIVRAFEKAIGGGEWRVTKHDGEEYKNAEKAKAEDGDADAVENLVWYLGAVDADWTTREAFAMNMLGLKDEDLDEATREAVQKFQ